MLFQHSQASSRMPESMSCGRNCIRRRFLFTGRVQGVGFRYTAKNIAIQHDVTGYVRNLPDGRVELILEGAPTEITGVVDALRARMTDHICDVETQDCPATGEFEQFHIRH